MKTRSKLIQNGGLVLSLALLASYVIYAQSKGLTEARETKEEFVLPSSKSLTSPVFSTSKAIFWLKNLPAPAALHSMSFTSESMSEKDTLRWKASWNRSWDLMRS